MLTEHYREGREGLSPRIRGNRVRAPARAVPRGSIPAHTGEPTPQTASQALARVYPRAYGGTCRRRRPTTSCRGLSPRIRGNHHCDADLRHRVGSIPAHTGEPESGEIDGAAVPVYPRAYGGTATRRRSWTPDGGLSPRIRGNRPETEKPIRPPGSIPAHTGEPRPGPKLSPTAGVYPRAYGGTTSHWTCQPRQSGLSPRIRGNRPPDRRHRQRGGSIPAHTGEPLRLRAPDPRPRVYPRAYGGTVVLYTTSGSVGGLSPRIRGNPRRPAPQRPDHGSIPAHTGEPTTRRPATRRRWVYPRAYGGTPYRTHRLGIAEGLSPRIRGNHRDAGRRRGEAGSIPAHTGEPLFPSGHRSLPGVYPRAYGGTAVRIDGPAAAQGLSPRIRGNLVRLPPGGADGGSIPAHTGEPPFPVRSSVSPGVYPRAYGGTRHRLAHGGAQEGLSPRIRGNPSLRSFRRSLSGSIPAHTGEPYSSQVIGAGGRVYPRAYGGTRTSARTTAGSSGLSPRIRGNHELGCRKGRR